MISILVRAADGTVLASAGHPEEISLSVDRVWQPGDTVRITGARHLRVQMDQALPAGEVYLPEDVMTWTVPAGEHRLAYAPGLFDQPRHIIRAAAVPEETLREVRNVALNPADLRGFGRSSWRCHRDRLMRRADAAAADPPAASGERRRLPQARAGRASKAWRDPAVRSLSLGLRKETRSR